MLIWYIIMKVEEPVLFSHMDIIYRNKMQLVISDYMKDSLIFLILNVIDIIMKLEGPVLFSLMDIYTAVIIEIEYN